MQGETPCFATLVERYQSVLFNLALRTVGDFDDAQDVTQSAFVKAYRNLGRFDQERRFFSWIYRITLNEAINTRHKRRPYTELTDDLTETSPDALERITSKERRRELNEAIGDLPELYRRVVELRHRSDLSYREIAEALQIPEKTVKSRLFTARRRLAAVLAAREPGGQPG